MIKLRNKDQQTIIHIAEHILPEDARLIAYGSRVSGTAHDTSDLDIVIQTPEDKPLKINEWAKFKEALQNSNLPILVDVFDWHTIPQTFKDDIMAQHEILWIATK